jgi:hypothetical protein
MQPKTSPPSVLVSDAEPGPQPPPRLSAKATRKDAQALTEAEIEAAEEEAQAWARRVNSC